MALAFKRPVGAAIDVKELEYISALHQTAMPKLREDASIHDVDVKYFLKSRYGIEVSIEEVRSTVLKGLGGGDEDEECIDLSELVAILLIPTLIKASGRVGVSRSSSSPLSSELDDGVQNEREDEARPRTRDEFESNFDYKQYLREREISRKLLPPEGIIEDVLAIMVGEMGDRDVDGRTPGVGGEGNGKRRGAPRLDEDLVRRLFLTHGERELAHDDDLVRQMVACASGSQIANERGGEVYFDSMAFARGLTSDVQNYHVENETKLTTNFYDVFKSDQLQQSAGVVASGATAEGGGVDAVSGVDVDEESAQDEEWDPNKQEKTEKGGTRRVRTFAAIDFVAETYRWKALVTLLWTGFILSYFAYRDEIKLLETQLQCSYEMESSNHVDELSFGYKFGCRVAQSIVNWLEIFAELCVTGLLYIGAGSLGNDIGSNKKWPIIVGMFFMICFTLIPPLFAGMDKDRDPNLYEELNYYMALVIGFIAIAMQLYLLVGRCLMSIVDRTGGRYCLAMTQFFVPGNVRAESMTKQAAAYKLNHMLKNAHALHYNSSDDSLNVAVGEVGGTFVSSALLKYAKSGKKYIPMGGFFWTWKRIFTKELYTENGMWLSGRIMSGNASQLLISIFIIVFGITVTRNTEANYNEKYQQVTSFIYADNTNFDGYVNVTVQKVNEVFVEQLTKPERTQKMREFVANNTKSIVEGSVQVSLDNVYSSIMDAVGSFNCSLERGSFSDCGGNVTKAESDHERKRKHQQIDATERQTQEITNGALNTTEGLDLVGTNEFTMNDTQSISDAVNGTNGTEIWVTNEVETTSTAVNDTDGSEIWVTNETQTASGFGNSTGGPDICMALDMLPLCDIMETGTGIYGQFESGIETLFDRIQDGTQDSVSQLEDKLFRLILNKTQVVVRKTTESYKPASVSMITIPMYLATGVSFLSMMYIVVTLIPSTSTTILMLRSGVIPTFRDPDFGKYRSSLHQMTLMLGFMFWGGLLSSALVGVVVGFVVFLFVYQVTRAYIWSFIAGAIGVAVSIVAKAVIFQIFKFFFYGRAFYRKRPAASNLASIGLECTNIGASVLFVIIRMAKVIVISLMYVGRIDTPLLAPGVGNIGAVDLDNANTIFRKTILAHEAHRHPYIETLGVMYLMKLHYGSRFATTSGSCWRLLFVLTLMPWLRKYRVMARPALEAEGEESACNGASSQTAGDGAGSRTKRSTTMEEENAELQDEIKRLKDEISALRSESRERCRDDTIIQATGQSFGPQDELGQDELGQDELGEEAASTLSHVQ